MHDPLRAYALARDIVKGKMEKEKLLTYATLGLLVLIGVLLVVDTVIVARKKPALAPAAPTTENNA